MTIASEITNYANGLHEAYAAVRSMGGIIPTDKNMNNLDAAIRTIPGGSPTPTRKDYGTIKYLPIDDSNVTATQQSKGGTFSWAVPNAQKLFRNMRKIGALASNEQGLVTTFTASGTARDADWYIVHEPGNGTAREYSLQQLSELGLNLTNLGTNSKTLSLLFTVTYDSNNPVEMQLTRNDYCSLGTKSPSSANYYSFSNYPVSIGDELIERNQIVEYSFGTDCDFIPAHFCYSCHNLTTVNGLESLTVEVIEHGFLRDCSSFNSRIIIPDTVTQIGGNFLSNCKAFNQPIDFNNVNVIANPKGITGELAVMSGCTSFNSSLTAPNLETFDGSNFSFLRGCTNFNQPLSLPKLKKVYLFLYNCNNFNQTLSLPMLEDAGYAFLYGCQVFNKPLSLPNLATASTHFLYDCQAFNQPISFPSLTIIGDDFMSGCISFNQPLTVPSTFAPASNARRFLYRCDSMTSTVTVECPAPTVSTPTTWLSTTNSTADCYTIGITIAGTERASWLAAFPDLSTSYYRKLIDGGA